MPMVGSSAFRRVLASVGLRRRSGDSRESRIYSRIYLTCLFSLAAAIAISFASGFLLREKISEGFKEFAGVSDVVAAEDTAMDPMKLAERKREEELLTKFLLNPEMLLGLSNEDRVRLGRAVNRLYRDFAGARQISAERALNRLALLRLSLTRLAGLETALNSRRALEKNKELGIDEEAAIQLETAIKQTEDRISEHALAYVQNLQDLKERSENAAVSCGDVLSILTDRYANGNTGEPDGDPAILAPRSLNLDNELQGLLIGILEIHCVALELPSESLVVRAMCGLFADDAILPTVCKRNVIREARLRNQFGAVIHQVCASYKGDQHANNFKST